MNSQEEQNLISPEAADLLISKRDGHMTLLYLYLCRTGTTDREQASRDLFLPPSTLNEAYERLEMIGLLPLPASRPVRPRIVPEQTSAPSPVPEPALELPSYTAQDVSDRADQDNAFSALLDEARLIIGRHLSSQDMIKLLGIYDHFDFPPEVVMELMHYVADLYRENYGTGRLPTVGAFEREARKWKEHQITDFDAAERYIQESRNRRSLYAAVKEAMNIINRDFTDTERRYVDLWLSLGFGPEAIALAYDKTVTNTRKFSPGYMNKILQNWHEKNLHTLQEIKDRDRPAPFRSGNNPSPAADPTDLRELVNRI